MDFTLLKNVFNRIFFTRKMYPLAAFLEELFLFPLDYLGIRKRIKTVRNLTFAITHACNIRCDMCYFHQELGNHQELSFELYKKIIDEFVHAKPCVILSGGEPFMHPQLVNMVAYAKMKKLPVQVFTNGTLATESIVARLIAVGVDYLNFSLLGPPEVHNRIARVPRAFERFLQNVTWAARNRKATEVLINYTITPDNVLYLDYAMELATQLRLNGLRVQHFNFLTPAEIQAQARCTKSTFGIETRTNEISRNPDFSAMSGVINAWIRKNRTQTAIPVQFAPTLAETEINNWYSGDPFKTERKCLFPWRGVVVDADGGVYPCSKIYLPLGSVNNQRVLQVWNGPIMQQFRRNLRQRLYPGCARCCKL
jgi:MoaA/NifB/PqqE/SkfB family radical SAM enzyme